MLLTIPGLFSSGLVPSGSLTRGGNSSNTGPGRRPRAMQRKRKEVHELVQPRQPSKKIKSSSGAIPSGTDGGEGNTQSGSGKNAEEPVKMPKLEPAKTPKLEPRVQSAIYAAHRLSSSFNNTHTINLILVGTWPRFLWALHYLTFHDVSQALQFFSPGSIDKMSSNPG